MAKPNEPAFPAPAKDSFDLDGEWRPGVTGLTKREHFAALAMQGFCSVSYPLSKEDAANRAVECADALLAELSKPSEG